jgi:hypothetical protein
MALAVRGNLTDGAGPGGGLYDERSSDVNRFPIYFVFCLSRITRVGFRATPTAEERAQHMSEQGESAGSAPAGQASPSATASSTAVWTWRSTTAPWPRPLPSPNVGRRSWRRRSTWPTVTSCFIMMAGPADVLAVTTGDCGVLSGDGKALSPRRLQHHRPRDIDFAQRESRGARDIGARRPR